MSDQMFYLFSAVLLGLVIGALIMYFSSGANRDSEKTIEELEKKLSSYQNEVAEHFEETANLVDDMTQSYKKVFDHLGKSARLLMTDEQIQEQIQKRKGNKVVLEFLTEAQEPNIEDQIDEILENIEENDKAEAMQESAEIVLNEEEDGEYNVSSNDDLENSSEDDSESSSEEIHELGSQELDVGDVVKSDNEDLEELEDLEQEVELREKNIYT